LGVCTVPILSSRPAVTCHQSSGRENRSSQNRQAQEQKAQKAYTWCLDLSIESECWFCASHPRQSNTVQAGGAVKAGQGRARTDKRRGGALRKEHRHRGHRHHQDDRTVAPANPSTVSRQQTQTHAWQTRTTSAMCTPRLRHRPAAPRRSPAGCRGTSRWRTRRSATGAARR